MKSFTACSSGNPVEFWNQNSNHAGEAQDKLDSIMDESKLSLNPEITIEGKWSEIFYVDDEREKQLHKVVRMAVAIFNVEEKPVDAIEYIKARCNHINEFCVAMFFFGQRVIMNKTPPPMLGGLMKVFAG